MIVGTAGHIDHGKTALVKTLTGTETDRLKEEKARGITIDLGFAYLPMADIGTIGFVDVPGHERFVHTMLAGAGGIDLALLVVAADDGVMPQTREHLAILDLLGIGRAVVALSKVDLVDQDRRVAVAAQIRAALAPTRFRDAPLRPVSTVTGEGLEALRETLAAMARELGARVARGRFRMTVDRCFTLAGAGTVVTGTVLSGTVAIGDRVMVSPAGLPARVRALHAQSRPAERGVAGERCALNLAGEGVTRDAIGRGDMVLDPALHAPTSRSDAIVRLLPTEPRPVGTWHPARIHLGSAEAGVRIVPLGDSLAPGGQGVAQLVLDRPVAACVGDSFVLRDVSARRTIGGGQLLDLRAPARKRRTPERLAALAALGEPQPGRALVRLLDTPPFVVDWAAFARDHALAADEAETLCRETAPVMLSTATGPVLLSAARFEHLTRSVTDALATFHAANADLQGLGRERLRLLAEPRLDKGSFAAALQRLVAIGAVVAEGGFVRLPEHEVRLSAEDEALWETLAPALAGVVRFRPPRVRDLAQALEREEATVRRILCLCARLGRVDQVAHDHFFLRPVTAEMVALATDAADQGQEGWFTAAAFRDRMDNGRKVAIQILDFLDRHGVTLRRGDLRRINPHRRDLFGASTDGRDTSPVGRPDFKSGWGSEPVPGGFDSHSLPPPGGGA